METLTSTDRVKCPLCLDMGMVVENGMARRCTCVEKKVRAGKARDIVSKSGLKGRLLEMSFENFKPRNKSQQVALEKVMRGGSFFIMGEWGVGKTHLLAASANDAVKKGVQVAYFSVPWLLQVIRDDLLSDRPIDVLRQIAEVEYLCLDDLGKEKVTETVLEKLFMIIDQREINGLRTSVTTNYDPETLEREKIDGAIVDRLLGMCEQIMIEGKSFRREK